MRAAVRREVRGVGAAALALALAPLPVLGSSYYEGVLARLLLLAVLGVGLNVVFGHTDQLFLFLGGLAGLGAYGTALLADWTGVTAWLTLVVAALLAGVVGLGVSWVSAKLRFTVVVISILTLNLQLVLSEAFVGARDVTGGSTGFPYRSYFSLGALADPLGISEDIVLYYLVLALLLAVLLGYVWLTHSRYGVAFDAIREDEVAAASIGIDVVYYKTFAGFLGGLVIGLTGAFMAREAGFMLPVEYRFISVDVIVLIVLIVGGLRTTLGPVVGAAIVVGIEQLLAAYAAQWRTAIFGALLIVLFLYFRQGVVREEALRYPTRRDDWIRTNVVGGVLAMFGFLLLPVIPLLGYLLAVIRGRIAGEPKPPAFEDWGRLFRDGLRAALVVAAYLVVPVGVGVGLAVGLAPTAPVAGVAGLLLVLTVGLLYLLPASLALLAATDHPRAAFEAAAVRRVVTRRGYAKPWLGALAVGGVVGAVVVALVSLHLLGWIAGAFVAFYVVVVLGALWGSGYVNAVGPDPATGA